MNLKLTSMSLLGGLLLIGGQPGSSAGTDTAAAICATNLNPYFSIIAHNAFRLAFPPTPVAQEKGDSNKGAIKLTGIIKIAGKEPRALFVSQSSSGKETLYSNLGERERDGEIELVQILTDPEGAQVLHAGDRLTLWLKENKTADHSAEGAAGAPLAPERANVASEPLFLPRRSLLPGVIIAGAMPESPDYGPSAIGKVLPAIRPVQHTLENMNEGISQ